MERTLLLNASFQPLKVISWRKAVILHFLDKVEIVEEYDREIRSVSQTIQLPAVIRLLKYVRLEKRSVKLSRETVFQRDHFTCQYCAQRFPFHKLTCDHVIPRSKGGKTSWDNLVTACLPCNTKKGSHPPEKVGISFRNKPMEPDWFQYLALSLNAANDHPAWRIYLPQIPN